MESQAGTLFGGAPPGFARRTAGRAAFRGGAATCQTASLAARKCPKSEPTGGGLPSPRTPVRLPLGGGSGAVLLGPQLSGYRARNLDHEVRPQVRLTRRVPVGSSSPSSDGYFGSGTVPRVGAEPAPVLGRKRTGAIRSVRKAMDADWRVRTAKRRPPCKAGPVPRPRIPLEEPRSRGSWLDGSPRRSALLASAGGAAFGGMSPASIAPPGFGRQGNPLGFGRSGMQPADVAASVVPSGFGRQGCFRRDVSPPSVRPSGFGRPCRTRACPASRSGRPGGKRLLSR